MRIWVPCRISVAILTWLDYRKPRLLKIYNTCGGRTAFGFWYTSMHPASSAASSWGTGCRLFKL